MQFESGRDPPPLVKPVAFMVWPLSIVGSSKTSVPLQRQLQCMEKGKFSWREEQKINFTITKEKLSIAPILVLPSFKKLSKVECDASVINIGVFPSQEGWPIKFFSEN